MDEQAYADTVGRLKKVNEVVSDLDPAIRSEAFSILKDYVVGEPVPHSRTPTAKQRQQEKIEQHAETDGDIDFSSAEDFFSKHDTKKPHENARLAAAWYFREYGSSPFSYDDIKAIGGEVGLTLPERIDMTLGAAKTGGKSLFKKAGRGRLRPTTHGETHMKTTYGIAKGTKTRT
jgi:hypothetical protein